MPDKTKRIPELRFPEFKDAGEWEEVLLGEIGEFTGGGTPSKSNETYWTGSIPWISSSDISDDSITEVTISRFITEEALQDSATKLIPKNSILLVSRVGVGKLAISQQELCTSQDFTNFTPSKDNFVFLAYYLKTLNSILLGFSQGMAIKGFTKEDISNLPILLPSLPEQKKIADCLSSLDELITNQAKKVEALNLHKKGLMQKLFPVAGEHIPRLRFPEFKSAEEWEEITLGIIGNVAMCKRILKEETTTDGDIPFYKIGTFGKQADAYISKEIFENYKANYSYPKKGDILISAAGTIGRLVVYDGEPAYFQDSNIVWIDNNESLVKNKFLYYCYQNINWTTDDNTIPRLYNDNLRGTEILIPSLPEQKKIADCLSSLDELITGETKKLTSLRQHKKGLMQKLFPRG